MRVIQVGVRELEGGPPTIVLSCAEEEAVAMGARLFELVELVRPVSECRFDECHRDAEVCNKHHAAMVTRAVDAGNEEAGQFAQRLQDLTRAARLVLGSLAAERDGAGKGNGLSPVTDTRAKALAQILGDPS